MALSSADIIYCTGKIKCEAKIEFVMHVNLK